MKTLESVINFSKLPHEFLSSIMKQEENCCFFKFPLFPLTDFSLLHVFLTVFSSVKFIHSFVSNYLWPYGPQHTRLPCPSPTPRTCSHSCPSSQWCHPTIPSSVAPFSSCLQSFPASGSFLMSRLLASRGQSIGASASASVLAMNIQDISLLSKGLSKVFSNTAVLGINSLALSLLYGPTLTSIHDYWKNHSFD